MRASNAVSCSRAKKSAERSSRTWMPLAAEPGQWGVEAHSHAVRRAVAEVLEHEEQQAAVEFDVEHDIGLSVLRDGVGHERSLPGFGSRTL
jgi:hypothetical protein